MEFFDQNSGTIESYAEAAMLRMEYNRMRAGRISISTALFALFLTTLAAAPVSAQEYPLIDKFSHSLSGANAGLSTEIRLDSRSLGQGTSLNFEDDLGLDANKIIPQVSFQFRLGRRHVFDGAWSKADRNSTSQALDEIRFGDIVIPW